MKNKRPEKPSPSNSGNGFYPLGVFLLLVGFSCIIGGIYIYLKGGMSTGYQTYKYGPGSVHGINGPGIIFFGVLFIIIGSGLSKTKKED